MKFKTVVLSSLIGVAALFFVHEFSFAQANAPAATSKIGLISVSRAMRDCKAMATFGAKAKAQADQMDAAEKKLDDEIEILTDGVRALVRGTADYMAQYKLLVQKQAELKALQEYHRELRAASQQGWAEKVYKEVLRLTQEIAATKGLDMVLERSEPEFPIKGADQLMMTLSTHKVLYGGGCLDITDEVIAELDKIESTLIK
ncbi:MAG: OmpH family outer membrane protein [Phycisphaerales bacterium]|nr:MAG: OmpH family outer membrane protein [Phycisphaerales bacterium]